MKMSYDQAIEFLSGDEKRCGAAVLDLQREAVSSERYKIFVAALVESSLESIEQNGFVVVPMLAISAFFMGFWCCQLMHCERVAPYPKGVGTQRGGEA